MTPLEQLIEARARAIYAVRSKSFKKVHRLKWGQLLDAAAEEYRSEARATLAADLAGGWKSVRREPTPEMIANVADCNQAHEESFMPCVREQFIEDFRDAWDAAPGMEG